MKYKYNLIASFYLFIFKVTTLFSLILNVIRLGITSMPGLIPEFLDYQFATNIDVERYIMIFLTADTVEDVS